MKINQNPDPLGYKNARIVPTFSADGTRARGKLVRNDEEEAEVRKMAAAQGQVVGMVIDIGTHLSPKSADEVG